MKLGNNIVINLERKTASVRLRMAFGESYIAPQLSPEVIAQMAILGAKRSLQSQEGAQVDPSLTFDQVNPQETDYIFPKFRALDAGLVEDYWLDFSTPGVVQNS